MAAKRSTKKPASRGKKPVAKKTKPAGKAKAKAKAAGVKKKVAAKKPAAKKPAARKKTSAPAARKAAPAAAKPAAAAFQSRFVWFDLVTPDVARSAEFYKGLFGWTTKEVNVGPPANTYTMLNGMGEDFGGLAPKMDSPAPTHWLPYVAVSNVDETLRRVQALGGKVFMPAMDIPNVGRFGIIGDPTGATVAPISFLTPPKPAPERGLVGPVAWCELATDDIPRAGQFYGELFGWGRSQVDMGPGGAYTIFKVGDQDAGGMGPRPPQAPASSWLTYFRVNDVDAKHQQALAAGARETMAPTDIPNIGRASVLVDPQGAAFALFKAAAA